MTQSIGIQTKFKYTEIDPEKHFLFSVSQSGACY